MILRVCLVIPTYNNSTSIATVVSQALEATALPVLVVDDGSDVPVAELISAHPRLTILRHPLNHGKGAALQTAIQWCCQRGYTHLMAMDGDGQHFATEVPKLLAEAKLHPWALIIGHRQMEQANVPKVSTFGRKFSNFWVHYETDQRIADSQSGFRLYPLFFLQEMKFRTRRFDFEIEILIRLMWRGVEVRECPIEVFYPPANERVSHFDKFWDNLRISCLNILLVIVTLLRGQTSARQVASAIAIGVFVGTTPFFGFHTLMAMAAAVLFRLNAVWVLIGTQVSLPFLAPFVIAASVQIGAALLGESASLPNLFRDLSNTQFAFVPMWDLAKTVMLEWFLGAAVLGSFLGATLGLLTFGILRQLRKKTVAAAWTGRTRGGRFGNGFLKLVLKNFGLRPTYLCLYFVVPYFWLFAPKARDAILQYWRHMEPQSSSWQRGRRSLQTLLCFAKILVDRVYQSFSPAPQFKAHPQGWHHLQKAAQNQQGALLLASHTGAWDLAAALLTEDKFVWKINVVKFLAKGLTFENIKESQGSEVQDFFVNHNSQPILTIREMLKTGEAVGLMCDRPMGQRIELVPFLGGLAIFDTTAFRVAAIAEATIIPTFGFRRKYREYDFFALTPRQCLRQPGPHFELQVYTWLADYVRELESMIRRYPDQWFNFFNFWSMTPLLPAPSPGSPTPAASVNSSGEKARTTNHLQEELRKPLSPTPLSATDSKANGATESRPTSPPTDPKLTT